MGYSSGSTVFGRGGMPYYRHSSLYRTVILVVILALAVPGAAAAWSMPFEGESLPAPQAVPQECGGLVPADVPADWPLVVCETFDDNTNQWMESQTEDDVGRADRKVIGGSLVWQIESLKTSSAVDWLEDHTYADLYVAVDANWVELPVGASQYALQFRRFDRDNFYSLTVDAVVNNYTLEMKYRGEWETLIDWTSDPAIRSRDTNRLAVLAQGSAITLFINGQRVAQYNDGRIAEGLPALAAYLDEGDRIHLSFDNFEIRAPSAVPQPGPTSVAPQPSPTSAVPQPQPVDCYIPSTAPAEWVVAVCEPFEDNRNAWPQGIETVAGGQITRETSGGTYDWTVEATQDVYDWVGYGGQLFSDFYASVQSFITVGKPETSVELVFRATDYENHYTFSASGSYYQVSVRYRGGWQELLPWTFSDELQAGFNDLAVLARGPELTFYINGAEVATLTNDLIAAGQVGVGATVYSGDSATIWFDDLLVLIPPELAVPTQVPLPSVPPPPPPRQTTPVPPTPAPPPTRPAPQPTQAVPQPTQAVPQPTQAVPQPTQAVPQPTQVVPPATGALYQNPEWGVSMTYPEGWVTMEESEVDYFSFQAGPSEQALEVFEEDFDSNMAVVAPVLALVGGDLSDLIELPPPDASGRVASAQMLEAFVSELLEGSGVTAGAIQPVRSADTDGSMVEVPVPDRMARMYLAGFIWGDNTGAFLLVITPDNQRDAVRQLFNSSLATLRFGTSPIVPPVSGPTPSSLPDMTSCPPPLNLPFGWQPIFCDTFTDNSKEWSVGDASDNVARVNRSIEMGVYQWMVEALTNATTWVKVHDGMTYTDLHLALDVPRIDGPAADTAGLLFRWGDVDTYYTFIVSADSFSLGAEVAGEWTNLIPWTESPALQIGQANHLEVTAVGPNITLYINGQKVGEIQDDKLSSGQVGLVSFLNQGDKLNLQFDNLQIFIPRAGDVVPTQFAPLSSSPIPGPTAAADITGVSAERECLVCGYVYDPVKGDPTQGIPAGTQFEDLPDDWTCPVCGAEKDLFF